MLGTTFMKKSFSNSAHKILYKNSKSGGYSNRESAIHTEPHGFKPKPISTEFQPPKLISRQIGRAHV